MGHSQAGTGAGLGCWDFQEGPLLHAWVSGKAQEVTSKLSTEGEAGFRKTNNQERISPAQETANMSSRSGGVIGWMEMGRWAGGREKATGGRSPCKM